MKFVITALLVVSSVAGAQQQDPVRPSVNRPEPRPPIVVVDPWVRGTVRPYGPPPQFRRAMMERHHRPARLEMMPLRENLTERQREELLALRKEYREKVRKILNKH